MYGVSFTERDDGSLNRMISLYEKRMEAKKKGIYSALDRTIKTIMNSIYETEVHTANVR